MGIARKSIDKSGSEHWHGSVDIECYELSKLFCDDAEVGCAECLAFDIQTAIEIYIRSEEALKTENEKLRNQLLGDAIDQLKDERGID